MAITSPLTGTENVELIEEILASDIARLYKKFGFKELSELRDTRTIGLYRCLDTDLRFFFPAVTGGAAFYEHLQTFEWYYLEEKSEYAFAADLLEQGDQILDVGCGKGMFGSLVGGKAIFRGLEFNDAAIRKAKSSGLDVIKESIEDHALNNEGRYDAVTAFQVLEHIGDLRGFIGSCLKAVKPGGKLIFSVPSYDSLVSVQLNNALNIPPHHVGWWSDRALRSLGDLFGMEVVTIHHEDLDKAHKSWYAFLLISESLKNLTGFRSRKKVIDRSSGLKLIHGVAKVLSPLLARGLTDKRLTPAGNSVTAVYRKKGASEGIVPAG